ncbi:uncharacterized protein LOC135474011 [Liolophura sinensis]|uniref:uncharacterized protein LOC135474011 n=1 Tax=Liolophura sinensis TaxID=3198878 RepID=UPI003158E631
MSAAMTKSGGCVIHSEDELESCNHDPQLILTPALENVTMTMINDRTDKLRGSGERRLREEAMVGFRTFDKPNSFVSDTSMSSNWNDVKTFTVFVLSLTFGIIMPVVQFVIGGAFFRACHDGNTFTVYLVIGGMLDIVGCSTFTGLVHRLAETEQLSRDPGTEWSKRAWNIICGFAIVAWIVYGQLKIYHLTHYRNPFRRDLPCAQEVGLTFYTQIFIVVKMVAIAVGLSLIVTYFLLKHEGRLCWRRYKLKTQCSLR